MAATLAFQKAVTTSGGATSRTLLFTSIASAAGQERLVALCSITSDYANTTLSNVQIDGQAATQVGSYVRVADGVSSNGPVISFWRASGTSSTSINVTCNIAAGAVFDCRGALWNLSNAGTPYDFTAATGTYLGGGSSGDIDLSLDVDTITNGAVAAAFIAYSNGTRTATWTGLTERYDGTADNLYSGDWFGAADLNVSSSGSTPLTVTADLAANFSFQSAAAGLAVSFNPSTIVEVIPVAKATVSLVGQTVTITTSNVIPVGKADILFSGQAVTGVLPQLPSGGGGVTVPPWRDLDRKKRRRYRALEEIEKRLDERIERLTAEARQIVVPRQTGELVPGQIDVLSQTVVQIDVLSHQAQINQMLHEAQRRAEKVRQERIELDRLARIASEEADDEEAIAMLMRFL